jgi:DMSO/TMAO reductase YedYZ molybdopterin-dependent catalytic subunit/thiosulfate reductase cytochrome b subunit
MSQSTASPRASHPRWLRLTHWLNALAVLVMVTSGWRIYNASPLYDFSFAKSITLGGWLGGALQWHFAAMWLLAINGLVYLAVNLFSGRLKRRFFPVSPKGVLHDLFAALRGKLGHADLTHYNQVQRVAYLFVMVDITLLVVSGLVLWKSVQFPLLRELLGGYDAASGDGRAGPQNIVGHDCRSQGVRMKKRIQGSGLDESSILTDARKIIAPQIEDRSRRSFLMRGLTLGGVAMLSGCNLTDSESVETALSSMSRFNDRVQGWLFNPNAMAPTYPESMITRPFPFNAFYGIDEAPTVEEESYRLEVTGLVADKRQWRLEELRAMAQTEQITRHICVEGWSAIGRWGGVRFSDFLKRVGADTDAKYVGFKCADDYYTSIDMATALHAQTLLTLTYDGAVLPREYGFPMKLRMPTKLGYKNPKHIQAIFVSNTYSGGYWEDQGYNWFGGS